MNAATKIADDDLEIVQRGGLTLSDLYEAPCCLKDWQAGSLSGKCYCKALCTDKANGCNWPAADVPGLVSDFSLWVDELDYAREHPQVAKTPKRQAHPALERAA